MSPRTLGRGGGVTNKGLFCQVTLGLWDTFWGGWQCCLFLFLTNVPATPSVVDWHDTATDG